MRQKSRLIVWERPTYEQWMHTPGKEMDLAQMHFSTNHKFSLSKHFFMKFIADNILWKNKIQAIVKFADSLNYVSSHYICIYETSCFSLDIGKPIRPACQLYTCYICSSDYMQEWRINQLHMEQQGPAKWAIFFPLIIIFHILWFLSYINFYSSMHSSIFK